MSNFAVAASEATIERANIIMKRFEKNGEKKELTFIRMLDILEKGVLKGAYPELEEPLKMVDETIVTLIKQINGVVAGQNLVVEDLKKQLDGALEEKLISSNKESEREKEMVRLKKELEQAIREREDAKELALEKSDSNRLLKQKVKEMETNVENYKKIQKDYVDLNQKLNDLTVTMREMTLKKEIEIEKMVALKEKELRKQYEEKIRAIEIENIRLTLEKQENIKKNL